MRWQFCSHFIRSGKLLLLRRWIFLHLFFDFFFFGNLKSFLLSVLCMICCTDGHFTEPHQLRWSGGKLWINYNIWYNHFNFLFEFTISAAVQSVVVFDIRFIQHSVFAAATAAADDDDGYFLSLFHHFFRHRFTWRCLKWIHWIL